MTSDSRQAGGGDTMDVTSGPLPFGPALQLVELILVPLDDFIHAHVSIIVGYEFVDPYLFVVLLF